MPRQRSWLVPAAWAASALAIVCASGSVGKFELLRAEEGSYADPIVLPVPCNSGLELYVIIVQDTKQRRRDGEV